MAEEESTSVPRIRQLITELNTLAHTRKETVDQLWILAKKHEAEDLQACVDRLWQLEDTGEHLRGELMRLLDDTQKEIES